MTKWILGACAALYLGFCLPLIPIGADDLRMVDVFSMDEASAVSVVRHLYVTRTWGLDTFSYGGLFYYAPLAVLRLLGGVGVTFGDRGIALMLRALCALAGVGCLGMVFLIGGRLYGQAAGVVAAFMLATTPVFLRWSVEIHPDVPQLFWLLCALYMCLRISAQPTARDVGLAGLLAGLAFGTKYSGAFLLPVIALAVGWGGGNWGCAGARC